MKILTIFLVFFASIDCLAKSVESAVTSVDEKSLELNISQKVKSSLSFEELDREVSNFNNYVGSYPPRFGSDNERNSIYKRWLSITSEAEAFAKENPETERALYILSELYRQGHNMDVIGSAEKAISNLNICLTKYEKSIPCNLSASYLYLSIGETYLGEAEKSLTTLREQFSPKKNAEVEAGYVMLYLFQRNNLKAENQIDQFIKDFPNSERVENFSKIKAELDDKAELKSPKTGKNILTEDHIICFKCETGFYPKSVQELVKFSPTNEACKAIFTNKRFHSNQPGFNQFLITTKEFDNSVAFAMSKKGFELEKVWSADAFYNFTIDKKAFLCGK